MRRRPSLHAVWHRMCDGPVYDLRRAVGTPGAGGKKRGRGVGVGLDPRTLSGVSLFAGLSADTLADVASMAFLRRYRRGMILFAAGEPSEAVFFVLGGVVRIYRDTPDGHEQTLQLMREGDVVNIVGFLDEEIYPASSETAADSELAVIHCAVFKRLVEAHADLAWAMLVEMSRRLR